MTIVQDLDQPSSQIIVWGNIGDAHRWAKRWAGAEEAYRRGLDLAREIDDRVQEAWRLNDLGLVAAAYRT